MTWSPRSTWLDDKIQELNNQLPNTAQQEEQSWWRDILSTVGKPFEWLGEHVEKPFASIVTAPFTPDIEGTEGMSWLERQRAEYDAWKSPYGVKGLIENIGSAPLFLGAGKVVGLGVKGLTGLSKVGKATEVVSKIGLTEADKVVAKLSQALPRMKLVARSQKLGISMEKAPKLERFMEKISKAKTPEEAAAIRSELSGAYEKIGYSDESLKSFQKKLLEKMEFKGDKYDRLSNQITNELTKGNKIDFTVKDIDTLWVKARDMSTAGQIGTSDLMVVQKGLENLKMYLFQNATIGEKAIGTQLIKPQYHQIKAFARVFGEDFANSIEELTLNNKILRNFLNIVNIPRELLSSFDSSFIGRQGDVLFKSHPIAGIKAELAGFKAMVSEKAAGEIDDLIKASKFHKEALQYGVEFTQSATKTASRRLTEEAYSSGIAGRFIPGIKQSERAFLATGNKFRDDVWNDLYPKWLKLGAKEDDFKGLARLINLSTGRGELPKILQSSGQLMNSIFFAPKYIMSRLELPVLLLSKSPFVRKEAVKMLRNYVLTNGTTMLTLAKLAGGEISLDPLSSDFGKVKFGNTRLDIWSGYAQYARFAAQLFTGQKDSATGNRTNVPRSEILGRFLQSKTAPVTGLLIDILKGQTYMGEDIVPKDIRGLGGQLWNRLTPLFIQDLADAINEDGAKSGMAALPGFFGVGVTTYKNDVKRVQNQIAQEKYKMSWEEVGTKMGDMAQYELGKDSPELQAVMEKEDEANLGTNYSRWREEGTNIETRYQDSINQASQEFAQTGDGYTFKEKVNNASMIRRALYDERNNQSDYKDIVASYNKPLTEEEKKKMNPLDLARRDYYNMMYSPDMTDEFGNYNFEEATRRKELFRQQYGDNSLKYVEEYMGMKFDAPPIYNELQKAQKVLQPYWQVENEIVKLRGIAFAQSKLGQALIKRTRDLMKIRNPLMAKYLKLFYAMER